MRNIPYWLNIGSILYQYGCATRETSQLVLRDSVCVCVCVSLLPCVACCMLYIVCKVERFVLTS